jgi:hypothetical protein
VFCGLGGARLQPTILAGIIHRTATRAGVDKHVTAHTLRHTAATWLRQATGDTRLVAEYLGHSDLSTVARYAHVAEEDLHAAVRVLAEDDGPASPPRATRRTSRRDGACIPGSSRPGTEQRGDPLGLLEVLSRWRALPGFSRAPAPSDSTEIAPASCHQG